MRGKMILRPGLVSKLRRFECLSGLRFVVLNASLFLMVSVGILGLTFPAGAASGDLDPAFGIGGKVTSGLTGGDAVDVAIQPDGMIIAVGYAYIDNITGYDFILERYTSVGSLDTTFGINGRVTTDFGRQTDSARAIALQPADGKIVVAGNANQPLADPTAVLARYNFDGTLDTTFGTSGQVTAPVPGFFAFDLAILTDGKILVVGFFDQFIDGLRYRDFAVVRCNSNGTLDTGFGSNGMVTTDFAGYNDEIRSIAIQADGKLLVAGLTETRVHSLSKLDFALARYNSDGTLDTGFNRTGKVTTDVAGRVGIYDFASSVGIQIDGKIIAAGISRAETGVYDFAAVRYTPDGKLDNSFGASGKVITDFSGGDDGANALAIQSDGRIVVGGSSGNSTTSYFALVRYNADGSLDTTFGVGGKVTTDFGVSSGGRALAIQSDGKIVMVGQPFSLARYLP